VLRAVFRIKNGNFHIWRIAMKKLLIADDDKNICLLCEEELSDYGYEVEIAKNGKECIEKFKTNFPDLVILDIRMPKMDGIETLGKIISENRDIPIIIYSAYMSYKEDFRSWGADAYIVKSSDLAELKEKITQLIQQNQDT
jgi:two-component system, response regulator, stage 0 sporulation protein F